MASVTGSRLAFFAGGVSDTTKINVVLTSDGINGTNASGTTGALAGLAIAGDVNIEVFTSAAGTVASGYQASAFIQGAQFLSNNAVQAGTVTSTEEILSSSSDSVSGFTGNLVLDDFSGGSSRGEAISIVGSSGFTYSVFGSQGDTITGSTVSGVSNYIDASGRLTPKNPPATGGPFQGAETVKGGAGPTTVRGGTGDVITGGAGSLVVTDEHHDGNQTVTGGSGSLDIFNFGADFSISGSTGGTTHIDDTYGGGGGSSILGGSGTGLISGSTENTHIVAASGDHITVGSALTYVDATKGDTSIQGGSGTVTGAIEGAPSNFNTNIAGGKGDVIKLGSAPTYVDASAGSQTITGGSGLGHIEAGKGDVITAGSGRLDINNIGNGDSITGGTGNLFSFGKGTGETISGSTKGWTLINSGGKSSILGGSGTTTVPSSISGGATDDSIINAGGGDTITAGAAPTTYINAVKTAGGDTGSDSITGSSGATTVLAGSGDTITGGVGTMEVDVDSDQGKITVDLSKGTSAATLRDVSVTSGSTTSVSVTGFSTSTDTIASKTSVNSSGTFLGTSKSDGSGGTILTFLDGSKMTLAGVSDVTKIKFTQ